MSKLQKIIILWIIGTVSLIYLVRVIGYSELSIIVILGSIGLAVYLIYQKRRTKIGVENGKMIYSNDYICTECGSTGKSSLKMGGSVWAEVIAWIISIGLVTITFGISLLLGIAYTASRRSNSIKVCKACRGKVIAVSSPEGKNLLKQYELN